MKKTMIACETSTNDEIYARIAQKVGIDEENRLWTPSMVIARCLTDRVRRARQRIAPAQGKVRFFFRSASSLDRPTLRECNKLLDLGTIVLGACQKQFPHSLRMELSIGRPETFRKKGEEIHHVAEIHLGTKEDADSLVAAQTPFFMRGQEIEYPDELSKIELDLLSRLSQRHAIDVNDLDIWEVCATVMVHAHNVVIDTVRSREPANPRHRFMEFPMSEGFQVLEDLNPMRGFISDLSTPFSRVSSPDSVEFALENEEHEIGPLFDETLSDSDESTHNTSNPPLADAETVLPAEESASDAASRILGSRGRRKASN